MPATFRPLLAAAALVAAFTACDNPNAPKAQNPVVADTVTLYSINDAPVGAPTAYYLLGVLARAGGVVASPTFEFDVALSVQGDGSVQLITPVGLAGVMTPSGIHRVGLQAVDESFDALRLAPAQGYVDDSLLTVTPGRTVAIRSANTAACPFAVYGLHFYAKLVVDSVKTDPARAFVRVTTDPNCDFRSLVPGVPEE